MNFRTSLSLLKAKKTTVNILRYTKYNNKWICTTNFRMCSF